MKAVIAVVRFETARRWLIFAGALLLGVLALLAPALPWWPAADPTVLRAATAVVVVTGLWVVGTVWLGGSVLATELAAGREGFYLARPIRPTALWLGRFLAALVLGLLPPLIALAPSLIVGPQRVAEVLGGLDAVGLLSLLVLTVTLISASAVLRILIQARSIWLLVAAVGGVVTAALQARFITIPVMQIMLSGPVRQAALMIVPAVWCVALLAATFLGSLAGRGDNRRVARHAGAAFLVLLFGLSLATAGALRWAIAATPHDAVRLFPEALASQGPWVVASARVERLGMEHSAELLLDIESGRWFRLEPLDHVPDGTPMSADGRRIVIGEMSVALRAEHAGHAWKVLQLPTGTSEEPRRIASLSPRVNPYESSVALSPEGRYLAVREGKRLELWEVDTEKFVAVSRRAPDAGIEHLSVDDHGTAWLLHVRPKSPTRDRYDFVALRLRTDQSALEEVWRVPEVVPTRVRPAIAATGDTTVFLSIPRPDGDTVIRLHDLVTGAVVWSAGLAPTGTVRQLISLPGPRVLIVTRGPEIDGGKHHHTATLVGPDGRIWSTQLGAARWAVVGPQTADDTVAVASSDSIGTFRAGARTRLLDLRTGDLRDLAENLAPAFPPWRHASPDPGSPASHLFIRGHRELMRLTDDGELEPVTFDREGGHL